MEGECFCTENGAKCDLHVERSVMPYRSRNFDGVNFAVERFDIDAKHFGRGSLSSLRFHLFRLQTVQVVFLPIFC